MSKLGELVVKLSVDPSEYSRNLDKAGKEAQKFGQNASASYSQAGMSAKQMSFATRGLPAQFTDIAVSLQGGQKPLTVLLQQGGQLKDMFGGIGPAAKAMGSYIAGLLPMFLHPFTLMTAAVAAFGVAIYQGRQQIEDLNRAIIMTGGSVGMSADELAMLADKVGEQTGKYSEARQAVQLLAASGQVSGDQMEVALEGVVNAAAVTGKSVEDLVKEFTAMGKDPSEAVKKLNENYNFLTRDVYSQILALEEQGKKQEATTLAFRAFADAMKDRQPEIQQNLGNIESAWDKIKKAIAGGTAELLAWGRAESMVEERKSIVDRLKGMEDAYNSGRNRTESQAEQIANSKAKLKQIDAQIDAQKELDAAKAKTAQANNQGVRSEDDLNKYLKGAKKKTLASDLNEENEEFQKAVAGLKTTDEKYQLALAGHYNKVEAIKKKYASKSGKQAETDEERQQREIERMMAGLQLQSDLLGKSSKEQELWKLRLANATKEQRDAAEAILDAIDAKKQEIKVLEEAAKIYDDTRTPLEQYQAALERLKKLVDQGAISWDTYERAVVKAQENFDKLSNAESEIADLKRAVEGFGREFTDTFVDGVMEGKLSFTDLANSIIRDLLRITVQKQVTDNILGKWGENGKSGSGLLGVVQGFFSTTASAKGNVFAGGNVIPFARGGAFTNGIVSRPTLFPMGLMGEAGEEAIMPLKRASDGSLGVRAMGAGINIKIINNAPAKVSAQQSADGNGVDILIEALDNAMGDRIGAGIGATSAALQSRYDLRPAVGG